MRNALIFVVLFALTVSEASDTMRLNAVVQEEPSASAVRTSLGPASVPQTHTHRPRFEEAAAELRAVIAAVGFDAKGLDAKSAQPDATAAQPVVATAAQPVVATAMQQVRKSRKPSRQAAVSERVQHPITQRPVLASTGSAPHLVATTTSNKQASNKQASKQVQRYQAAKSSVQDSSVQDSSVQDSSVQDSSVPGSKVMLNAIAASTEPSTELSKEQVQRYQEARSSIEHTTSVQGSRVVLEPVGALSGSVGASLNNGGEPGTPLAIRKQWPLMHGSRQGQADALVNSEQEDFYFLGEMKNLGPAKLMVISLLMLVSFCGCMFGCAVMLEGKLVDFIPQQDGTAPMTVPGGLGGTRGAMPYQWEEAYIYVR